MDDPSRLSGYLRRGTVRDQARSPPLPFARSSGEISFSARRGVFSRTLPERGRGTVRALLADLIVGPAKARIAVARRERACVL